MFDLDKITIIYPYWNSPKMFKIHQRNWISWPESLTRHIEFIVVDDCSQEEEAESAVILPTNFLFRLYRVTDDVLWNWRTCRNIGAYEADINSWLFMTDMDLLIPVETIEYLLSNLTGHVFNKRKYYTFDRVIAPDMVPYKNHPNTYFLYRELYLRVGGYDEIVSGLYGLDGVFRHRLEHYAEGKVHLDGKKIISYQRDYVSDASVSTLQRKEGRDTPEFKRGKELLHDRFRNKIKPLVRSFPYERLI